MSVTAEMVAMCLSLANRNSRGFVSSQLSTVQFSVGIKCASLALTPSLPAASLLFAQERCKADDGDKKPPRGWKCVRDYAAVRLRKPPPWAREGDGMGRESGSISALEAEAESEVTDLSVSLMSGDWVQREGGTRIRRIIGGATFISFRLSGGVIR